MEVYKYSKEGFIMKSKTIITIGRQFGSGGHVVGERLAEKLGIPFYDKELIAMAARESGYSEKLFEEADEKPTNSFLYSLAMGSYIMGSGLSGNIDMPINDKLFVIQSNIIQKIADEGSCIIVGRCADYILKDNYDCVNVFIHADMKVRIKNISEKFEVTDSKAEDMIIKTDKKRASYYNYFSSANWGKIDSYHLSIDAGLIGIDNAAELIKTYVEMKNGI